MLKEYWRMLHRQVEIVEYNNGEALIADVEENECHVELIFLDIYMTGINGLETAKKLQETELQCKYLFFNRDSRVCTGKL